MSDRLKKAGGAGLLIVNGSSFLFNEDTQELYALNAVAAYIWACIEDGLGIAETAEAVAGDLRATRAEADAHVHRMVGLWIKSRMLLDGTEDPGAPPSPVRRAAAADGVIGVPFERPAGLRFPVRRVLRLLSQDFVVRLTSTEADARVMAVLGHLATRDPAEDCPVIDVIADGSEGAGAVIAIGAGRYARCRGLDELAPALKAQITAMTIAAEPHALAFHAAAVSSGGGSLLLPAASGSGKSTLTAALLRAGFGYLSDDIVLLDQPAHRVRGLPLPICIKAAGAAALRSHYPALERSPLHLRADDQRVRYLIPPPDAWSLATAGEPRAVEWIVFPRYDPDRPTALERIDGGRALARLLPQAAAGIFLERRDVEALAAWIATRACYELGIASLADAIEALRSLDGFAPDVGR